MKFRYLASPYSRYPGGEDAAHRDICVETARLFAAGVTVLSPISGSHCVYRADPSIGGQFESWEKLDHALILASCGVIVCMLDGWEESRGIQAELDFARSLPLPVVYMEPGTVPEGLTG